MQDYPLDEVQAACRKSIEGRPNHMPNEGNIKALIIAARRNLRVVPQQDLAAQDEPRVTGEQADRICKDVGFKLNRFGGTS